jgi:predicted O-methyltransferase YrrM
LALALQAGLLFVEQIPRDSAVVVGLHGGTHQLPGRRVVDVPVSVRAMNIRSGVVQLTAKVPRPVRAAGSFWSVASSAHDQAGEPSDALVELLLAAAQAARTIDLTPVVERATPAYAPYVQLWPGEHYRLLAGIVTVLKPAVVVEIGTFLGLSALTMLQADPDVRVVTFDIAPWRSEAETALRESDFIDGRLTQVIGNLAEPAVQTAHMDTLREADFLFVDGPKDGVFERTFVADVLPELTDRRRIVGFDDIRMLQMAGLWRALPYPKLDATSLGHWSGTGLLSTN